MKAPQNVGVFSIFQTVKATQQFHATDAHLYNFLPAVVTLVV